MPVDVQVIESLDFFHDLKMDENEEFAAQLKPREVKKGAIIIRKGTPALTFFILLSGAFEISSETGKSVTVDKPGEIMGWSTVVAPFEYMGTATALKDSNLLYISSQNFFRLIQNNNELGEKVMKKIQAIATMRRKLLASRD